MMQQNLTCCGDPNGTLLDANYWNAQYLSNTTGWDLGMPSPPLVDFINSLDDKKMSVLIPGCGNAYEAEYLLQQGFTNVTLVDISADLVKKLQERFANNANIRVVHGDFFELNGATFDVILEQTFFCALEPFMREIYVQKMNSLLSDQGVLAGLLFNREFEKQGPPFGGNVNQYQQLFVQNGLEILEMELCKNSVAPRANSEVFFIAKRKEGVFEVKNPCCSI